MILMAFDPFEMHFRMYNVNDKLAVFFALLIIYIDAKHNEYTTPVLILFIKP